MFDSQKTTKLAKKLTFYFQNNSLRKSIILKQLLGIILQLRHMYLFLKQQKIKTTVERNNYNAVYL